MFPTAVDQTRQDNGHPQLLHLYMHCCPCSGVLYNSYSSTGYRPHFITYQPRPYNLHHYQYTQFNMSPYNLPLAPTTAVVTPSPFPAPPSQHQNACGMDLAFGPPPRDRRNLERQDPELGSLNNVANEDKAFDIHEGHVEFPINVNDASLCQTPPQLSTQNSFLKFLESSCLAADQIAYRNRNRPCFRNIQNLCIRTRNEILKPSTTISNIHSQGIPWATKDFIYAFIRLTNCWQILKGYLENKEGNLGKIEKELTPEFKACYSKWEKDSMELADHLTRIFCNLDSNISNPNSATCSNVPNIAQSVSHISLLRSNSAQSSPKNLQQADTLVVTTSNSAITSQPSKESLKGVRGILHIPQVTTPEMAEPASSSENSPHDDESDNEGRVYMKPGSYNVPKKSSSVENSPRSIEFLDTAQNVGAHRRSKIFDIPVEKLNHIQQLTPTMETSNVIGEDLWVNPENSDKATINFLNITEENEPDVQTWINNSSFDFQCSAEDLQEKDMQNISYFSKPVCLLQRPKQTVMTQKPKQDTQSQMISFGDDQFSLTPKINRKPNNAVQDSYLDMGCFRSVPMTTKIQSRTYRKRSDGIAEKGGHQFYSYNRNFLGEQKNDALIENYLNLCEDIVNQLRSTELSMRLLMERCNNETDLAQDFKNPTNLDTIIQKLKNKSYKNLNEIIHDIRHIIKYTQILFETQPEMMKEVASFSRIVDTALSESFPNFDFSNITGHPDEDLGCVQYKKQKQKLDCDGDQ